MTNVRARACVIFGGMAALLVAMPAWAQTIGVNPQALNFVYQIGGPNPAAQNLFLSSDVPSQFSVTTSGASWLTIAPTSGVTPATLVATVVPPAGATPVTLSGSIIIGPAATVDPLRVVIPVTLQILPPPQGNLVVAPSSLVADYRVGGPVPVLPPVSITSTGGPAAFSLTTNTTSGGPWLSVTATSLVTPSTAYVAITPSSSMAPGIYTGTVSVIPGYAGGANRLISVTLRVSTGGALAVSPTYLAFDYETGRPTPDAQYLRVVDPLGTVVPFSVSVSTSSGMWLSVSPVTAVTPTSIAVRVLPAAMPPGPHYGTITIQPSTGPPTQIPVGLTVTSSPQLRITPESLSFDYQLGRPPAAPQYIHVTSTGSPVPFTANVVGPTWVTVSEGSTVTPASLAVSINPPSTTVPGTYSAAIVMTPTSSGSNPISAQITVNVKAANLLSVSQSSVSFVYSQGAAVPTQMVSVTSSGGSAQFQAAGSTPWVSLSQTASYTPANLSINVQPQGMAPGTYHDRINVFSDDVSNSPQTIDVTLTISSEPLFSAAPFGLMFSHQIGGAPPANQLAVITNTMPGQSFSVSAETESGGNWLIVAGGGPAPAAVAAGVDSRLLTTPGTYSGTLVITPSSASTPVLRVPVFVNVSLGPSLRTSTNLMAFQYQTGGAALEPQKLSVSTTGGALGFYSSVRTADGGSWLKVSPTSSSAPADLTVTVEPAGLAQGLYLGLIALTGVGSEQIVYYVPVTLQVSGGPVLTVQGQSAQFQATVGGTRPAAQTVRASSTASQTNIAASASAGWLRVEPTSAVGTLNLSVQAVPDGMSAGYYLGLITIHIPGVTNSEQYVPVALSLNDPAAQ